MQFIREGVMTRLSAIFAMIAVTVGAQMSSTAAVAQTQGIAGTWAWISVGNTAPDGTMSQPFGPTPGGYIIFDSGEHFVWLITRPDRPKFASGKRDQGTADENKAAVQGSLGYAGTYFVSGEVLVLKIDSSTYPNEVGAEQRRIFTLTGDELMWRNPTVSTGAAGIARLRRLQ